MEIIDFVWEYEAKELDRNDIKLPNFITNDKKTYVGIPYCWGGYISIDLSDRKEVKNFTDAIKKGYFPGNILTEGVYKDKTAGLDCSGYIGAVFKLREKVSTETLKNYFSYINLSEIKPMDIFNSENNHTFIYLKESYDKNGIITLEARHSDSIKSKDKTVVSYRTYEEINKGINGKKYKVMRYKGIIDDEVSIRMDQYEFNNNKNIAYPAKKDFIYAGGMDYIEDVDYFKLLVDEHDEVLIKIYQLPKGIEAQLIDDKENVLMYFDSDVYKIKLNKGIYYLKFSNKEISQKYDKYIFEVK
ncbi:hypothetical protein [Caloramator mitchellensis]|nr:hypothetical protein [Caloramator mitchellensis]